MNIKTVEKKFKEIVEKESVLNNLLALIYWDGVTGAPEAGIEMRAKTSEIVSKDVYEVLTSKELSEYADIIIENKDKVESINYILAVDIKKEQKKLTKISKEEYGEFVSLCSKSEFAWEQAKEEDNYELFYPYLEKIVKMQKKFIEARGYNKHPYNTLLDDYEPDMTVEKLDSFFAILKEELVPFAKKICKANIMKSKLGSVKIPVEKQKEFNEFILNHIGYNFKAGMVKESEHPFTIGFGPSDVRITTHYYEENFLSAIYSTIHEAGHAIYEQNIEKSLEGTRMATGSSMGIHESQSRLFENIFGRSREFWKPIYSKLKETTEGKLDEISEEDFYKEINNVRFSEIRIEADELTYTLHIMVRYEIEKGLFDGSLDIKKLPEIWNEKYKEYFGIVPENYSKGVLQDSHWAGGLFGYFPSYAIGNAYSLQILNQMNKDIDVSSVIAKGDFKIINSWLKEKIHKYGKTKTAEEIIKNIAGEELNPKYYIEYLKNKFTDIYL